MPDASEYWNVIPSLAWLARSAAEELLKNGLVSALNDFAVSVPNARFQAVGDILLDKDKELVLYRCAYELVNNARIAVEGKHHVR